MDAPRAEGGLLLAQRLVAHGAEDGVERGAEVAAVVDERVAVAIRNLQFVRQITGT